MSYLALIQDWLMPAAQDIMFNVVIAFLLVALGVCLGFIVKGVTMAIFRGVKLDEFVSKLHIGNVFGNLSVSELFADIFEVAIILAFTVQALSFLGWELIADALSGVLYWIPGVIAALVVFLVFYAIGKWVELRMRESSTDVLHRLAPVVLVVIAVFGAVLALDQVGFDTSLIKQSLLILVFGFAMAFAIAVGIAAGFGLRDEAAGLVTQITGHAPKKTKSAPKKRASSKKSASRRKK